MTRAISVLQLGIGQVGAAVARLVVSQAPRWLADFDVDVRYAALADSTAFVTGADGSGHSARGLAPDQLFRLLDVRTAGQRLASVSEAIPLLAWERVLDAALGSAAAPEDLVVLDCASGHATTPLLLAARASGAHVVLANKDPLIGPLAQYHALASAKERGSLHASATVGAGLPVVAALRALAVTGDSLLELEAQASGSLSFICAALSTGVPFDEAVRQATAHGYTEPDPRQDLSGFDVARKLLILARSAGAAVELSDVRVESLVPPGAQDLSPADFEAALSRYSDHLAERSARARADGRVLRYVARRDAHGALSASLRDLRPDDPLAQGQGSDNLFILRTTRYDARPLVIAGPGAGIDVTAGAVVADLLRAVGAL